MAHIIRSAKSGSDWTTNELAAYRVAIRSADATTFFGQHVADATPSLDAFLTHSFGDETSHLPERMKDLCEQLEVASTLGLHNETTIDLLAYHLLHALEYSGLSRLRLVQHPIPLPICGKTCQAETDVAIATRTLPDVLVLLVQENKTVLSAKDPVSQLVAEAIAAFHNNNHVRAKMGLNTLERMEFPALTMVGTRVSFYRIPVTKELSDAVAHGQYPDAPTEVLAFSLPTTGDMMDFAYRREAVRHLEAFRGVAEALWDDLLR